MSHRDLLGEEPGAAETEQVEEKEVEPTSRTKTSSGCSHENSETQVEGSKLEGPPFRARYFMFTLRPYAPVYDITCLYFLIQGSWICSFKMY